MRKYAQIHLSVWSDKDFLNLTNAAQLLYIMLISHPKLSHAGVVEWRPAKLAKRGKGWTKAAIQAAAGELMDADFILVDDETEEVLVRTYVRNDEVLKRGNMGTAVARCAFDVASEPIRALLVHELRKIQNTNPGLSCWKAKEMQRVLEFPSLSPKEAKSQVGTLTELSSNTTSESVPGESPTVFEKSPRECSARVPGESHESSGSVQKESPVPVPVPLPTTPGLLLGEGLVGVKGGPGGKGEGFGRETSGSGGNAPHPENPESRAGSAAAAAATPRGVCPKHPNGNPDDVPCRGCAQARKEREHDAQQAEQAEEARRAERRAAIEGCDRCDERGMATLPDGRVYRCDHSNMPVEQEEQPRFEEQSDPEFRRKLLDELAIRRERREEGSTSDEKPSDRQSHRDGVERRREAPSGPF